jgi:DNA (cytosine-5)-methyltransferase 1
VRVLSLFSGIGGLDLGLERAGMTVVGQSEIDPYASRVLAKHWPGVLNLGDITTITEESLERLGPIDLVCGGFPCQDLSVAGKQAGINASRSGLFFDLMRVVRLVAPRYVLLENVPTLLSRSDWMGAVLGELAESGFDAEWDCIPAQAVGAPHRRDRVFVIAVADAEGGDQRAGLREGDPTRQRGRRLGHGGGEDHVADADRAGREEQCRPEPTQEELSAAQCSSRRRAEPSMGRGPDGLPAWVHPDRSPAFDHGWEDGLPRVSTGVHDRVARLRCLGNSVVPQVAEHVGRIIQGER